MLTSVQPAKIVNLHLRHPAYCCITDSASRSPDLALHRVEADLFGDVFVPEALRVQYQVAFGQSVLLVLESLIPAYLYVQISNQPCMSQCS